MIGWKLNTAVFLSTKKKRNNEDDGLCMLIWMHFRVHRTIGSSRIIKATPRNCGWSFFTWRRCHFVLMRLENLALLRQCPSRARNSVPMASMCIRVWMQVTKRYLIRFFYYERIYSLTLSLYLSTKPFSRLAVWSYHV